MKSNATYNHLIKEAEGFLSLAQKEYEKGKKSSDDKIIRQGAEKAWNAAVQATKALALKTDKTVPRSYKAQYLFLYEFEKKHNGTLNGYPLSRLFKLFSSGLHGECFYHGEYEFFELDHDFEEVTKFIDIIKKQKTKNLCNNL